MTKKKSISNNLKEWKTTVSGFLVWIVTGVYFFMPYFSDRDLWEVNHYEATGGFIVGLLLILAPDRLVDFLFKWMDKRK